MQAQLSHVAPEATAQQWCLQVAYESARATRTLNSQKPAPHPHSNCMILLWAAKMYGKIMKTESTWQPVTGMLPACTASIGSWLQGNERSMTAKEAQCMIAASEEKRWLSATQAMVT